jgi:hypothetical protein
MGNPYFRVSEHDLLISLKDTSVALEKNQLLPILVKIEIGTFDRCRFPDEQSQRSLTEY